jgi:hypothetical protein
MVKESEHQNKDKPDKQMIPLSQMNIHWMCPKYFPNVLGVPFRVTGKDLKHITENKDGNKLDYH